MKRELFNIADEEFMTLLQRAGEGFRHAEIPYMFVGGVANQTHIARYLCDIHKSNLSDLIRTEKVRIQDCIRSTDDVDIVTRLKEGESLGDRPELHAAKKIFDVLDYIVGDGEFFSPTEEHIVEINVRRRAHARPIFELGIDGVMYPDKVVSFNIYRNPKDLKNGALKEFEDGFYDLFLNSAMSVEIPFAPQCNLSLRVKNPDHLLATKIARGRPKDMNDALSLVKFSYMAQNPINYSIVEEILCGEDPKYHQKRDELCRRYEAFRKLEQTLNSIKGNQ